MAIKLENKVNVIAPDSDYPYGAIKDDSGAGDGTPIDVNTYGDFHQFFARFFAESGLVYNDLPDNDYTGFQYYEAAKRLWQRIRGTVVTDVSIGISPEEVRKLISVEGSSADVNLTLKSSASNFLDGDSIIIRNNSDFGINIVRTIPDTFEINGLGTIAPINLPLNGDFIELVLEKSTNTWRAASFNKTDTGIPSPVQVSKTGSIGSGAGMIVVFDTIIYDIDGIYDNTTGEYTCPRNGFYKMSVSGSINTTDIDTPIIDFLIYKNAAPSMRVVYQNNTFQAITFDGSDYSYPFQGNAIIQCLQGDVIKFVIDSNNVHDYTLRQTLMTIEFCNQ